ncbi:MAG: hypothetical protein HFJ37_04990 [Clostridia bacterium]|nr:hypothetical protein [Clostridia bacterium]
MREKIKYIMGKKSFHIGMVIIIMAVILFTVGILALRYNVEGETNMPFHLSRIVLISSSEGMDKEAGENKWAFDINQNNDIYLYIEKNKNYNKQEVIKAIEIDNLQVQKEREKGTITFYRPNVLEEGGNFSNKPVNLVDKIEYIGATETNLKDLKVSNQGGVIVFRYANDKVAQYVSNEEEVNHNDLLKKSKVEEEDLKATITFDLTIKLESGKEYKANITLDMPVEGILEKGTTSKEITEVKDIIFKRTKN